jgi:hypothetical protein
MFAAKTLQEMAPPGLTFGEHCVNLESSASLLKVPQQNNHSQI